MVEDLRYRSKVELSRANLWLLDLGCGPPRFLTKNLREVCLDGGLSAQVSNRHAQRSRSQEPKNGLDRQKSPIGRSNRKRPVVEEVTSDLRIANAPSVKRDCPSPQPPLHEGRCSEERVVGQLDAHQSEVQIRRSIGPTEVARFDDAGT